MSSGPHGRPPDLAPPASPAPAVSRDSPAAPAPVPADIPPPAAPVSPAAPAPVPADIPPPAAPVSPAAPAPVPADIPRSRALLALLALAAGYAALRLAMNREFEGAPWDELLAFTAPKPFGLRVLIPLLVWPLHAALRLPIAWIFALVETLATAALAACLARALRPAMPARWADALGLGFLLLLPIPFLLQHRWPIFYPYDTPAMAFTAAGVALVLAERWRAAAALVFCAALNRESAVLLPFAALALHWPASDSPVPKTSLRPLALRSAALLAAYAAARLAVGLALADNPGAPLQFFVDQTPRLLLNLAWLEEPAHWPLLPAYLGFIPLLWLVLSAWIPPRLRRLGWVALVYLGALMWVANIDEPRVYGEPMVLLWIPAAVGLARWLRAGERA
ncbi:MAG: hypothetical protein JNL82_12495 [Myxococcales bacterium]|nr:hypothetical protein [Myxococcales bacterium]